MRNQNSNLHNKNRGGERENERVTEKEQEKIHMSPHLHPASMSASYITLLHNKSENPTSQLSESSSKPRYYQQGMRLPGLISKVQRLRRSSGDRILVDQLKPLPLQIQIQKNVEHAFHPE